MPKYLIERTLPGAGALSDSELASLSNQSNAVLAGLGDVQWIESHVTADKVYCIYVAPDEGRVREHAERGGFPLDSVALIARTIDPTTGGR